MYAEYVFQRQNSLFMALLHTYIRTYIHTCRLQQQYPAFAPGVRLCKRWVSAHLLSPRCHLSEEAVELMVAHLFLRPASGGGVAPGFHTVVLLRFLSLLATHDWASEPLVVDPNNELSREYGPCAIP